MTVQDVRRHSVSSTNNQQLTHPLGLAHGWHPICYRDLARHMRGAFRSEAIVVSRNVEERAMVTQRTYFVHGHRVEETRHAPGYVSFRCDCAEYLRAQARGEEASCVHSQRVAAAASLDQLLGAKGLMLRA